MPESIHTKDESKRGTAFAFIFGVNWLWRRGVTASFGVFFHEMRCSGMTSFMEFMCHNRPIVDSVHKQTIFRGNLLSKIWQICLHVKYEYVWAGQSLRSDFFYQSTMNHPLTRFWLQHFFNHKIFVFFLSLFMKRCMLDNYTITKKMPDVSFPKL